MDSQVLGVAVGDGVDEPVAVDHVGVDGPAVEALEARRHEQVPGPFELPEQPLVGLRGGDVGLVDHDEVDVLRGQLAEQVVGVLAGAQGVEVGHDDVGGQQSLPRDPPDGALLPIEGEYCRGPTARDQRPTREVVEDVAGLGVVECRVEGAPDDAAGRDDEGPPAGEAETGHHPQRSLPGAHRHDARRVLASAAVVVGQGAERLLLAAPQRQVIQLVPDQVEVAVRH